jgi:hypothetical protein
MYGAVDFADDDIRGLLERALPWSARQLKAD